MSLWSSGLTQPTTFLPLPLGIYLSDFLKFVPRNRSVSSPVIPTQSLLGFLVLVIPAFGNEIFSSVGLGERNFAEEFKLSGFSLHTTKIHQADSFQTTLLQTVLWSIPMNITNINYPSLSARNIQLGAVLVDRSSYAKRLRWKN